MKKKSALLGLSHPGCGLVEVVVSFLSNLRLFHSLLLPISAVYSISFRFYYFASDVLYDIKLVNLFWRLFYLLQLVARTAQYQNVAQHSQFIYSSRYITCGIYYGKNNNSSSSLSHHDGCVSCRMYLVIYIKLYTYVVFIIRAIWYYRCIGTHFVWKCSSGVVSLCWL